MHATEVLAALLCIVVRALALPDDLVLKVIFPEHLIEHDFDVVAGVPVAVVVEAAGFLQDARQLLAAWPHVVDVGLGVGVAVLEGAFFFGLAPEDFVVPVAVERRVDVDQVHARVGELGELFEVVAAEDDAGVEEG